MRGGVCVLGNSIKCYLSWSNQKICSHEWSQSEYGTKWIYVHFIRGNFRTFSHVRCKSLTILSIYLMVSTGFVHIFLSFFFVFLLTNCKWCNGIIHWILDMTLFSTNVRVRGTSLMYMCAFNGTVLIVCNFLSVSSFCISFCTFYEYFAWISLHEVQIFIFIQFIFKIYSLTL